MTTHHHPRMSYGSGPAGEDNILSYGCAPCLARPCSNGLEANEADYRQQILDLTPTGRSLLDVGCDTGAWTMQVAGLTAAGATKVAGLEITDARHQATARGIDVRPGDLEEPWPFDDQSFDIVHANQVIEHVKRLDHFVSEGSPRPQPRRAGGDLH